MQSSMIIGQAVHRPPPSAAMLPSICVFVMVIDSFCRKPCWLMGSSEESAAGPWMHTPPPCRVRVSTGCTGVLLTKRHRVMATGMVAPTPDVKPPISRPPTCAGTASNTMYEWCTGDVKDKKC